MHLPQSMPTGMLSEKLGLRSSTGIVNVKVQISLNNQVKTGKHSKLDSNLDSLIASPV